MPLFKNPFRHLSKTNTSEAGDDISQVETKPNNNTSKKQDVIQKYCGDVKFLDMPQELILHIGEYSDVRGLYNFALCNSRILLLFFNVEKSLIGTKKRDYEKLDETDHFERVQQVIWKNLVLSYFPRFEKSLNVKNWLHLLRRRMQHAKLHGYRSYKLDIPSFATSEHDEMMIENCEWVFKCSLKFDDLKFLPLEKNMRFCNVCNKNVYKVQDMDSFKKHVKENHCVAFTHRIEIEPLPNYADIMVMGKCAPIEF